MPLQATSGAASYDAFGGGVPVVPNYIEEVFSTYLYTGNGSTQTITNGIDLSTEGGLVWIKSRNLAEIHQLFDTERGIYNRIYSNLTNAQNTGTNSLTAFNSNGFSIGDNNISNTNNDPLVSWTFRKQPKFFDVVTYTGNGTNRTIAHNLGSVPGCIMVKCTSAASDWSTYHRSLANTNYLLLNTTAASASDATRWNSTTPTSTVFSLGTGPTNNAGETYVAYIFAHDAGGFGLLETDNVISCGTYTGTGTAGLVVTLGYEPQWVLIKRTSSFGDWWLVDNMRGMPVGADDAYLYPNSSAAEAVATVISPTATGFTVDSVSGGLNGTGATYIYIAIRRGPMKVPTVGTSVYESTTYTGNNTAQRKIGSSVLTDLLLLSNRDATATEWSTYAQFVFDRLRGQNLSLSTSNTNAEVSGWDNYCNFDMNTGWDTGSTADQQYLNKTSSTYVSNAFRRAPSFMDVVCYTGTGVARTIAHNLAAVPELMIVKRRSASGEGWRVWQTSIAAIDSGYVTELNGTDGVLSSPATFNSTAPTATVFTVGDNPSSNSSGVTYVAYLFATCAGVSKVFSFTGNGSSQTINCGFTGGARWILIKRTDSTGDWYCWDSARGIVSGNDPHLSLNTTAAEVTSDDTIDTDSTGFVVNQVSATNVNVSSATYIGLAIA